MLLFFFYDSMFAFIGATAGDVRQAQVLASPAVSIFMLFNGLVVTQKDAPTPLKWLFYISPNAYAMKGITCSMAEQDQFKDNFFIPMQLEQMDVKCDEPNGGRGVIILIVMIA